jgi:Ca-activated chloride channel family protein
MPPRTDARRCALIAAPLAGLLGMLVLSPALSSAPQGKTKTNQQDDRKKPVKPELGSKSPQENPQKDFKIGVNVDLVVVHTSVVDKNGQFVSGLKKENFKVFEDGVNQNIVSFSQEDVPISLGIVIDTSGSMRNKFDNVIKAALAFIRASNPNDQVFLVGLTTRSSLSRTIPTTST